MFNPKPRNDIHFSYPKQCFWLKLNGSWPLKTDFKDSREQLIASYYKIWSWYVIISVGITIYFQTAFLIYTFGDIIMTTENCCTTFMGALNFIRLLHLKLKQQQFKVIIDEFVRSIWIKKNLYPEIDHICNRKMRIFRNMTILLVCLILMYCVMPLVELFTTVSVDANEKPFPYKMLFPYDAHHGFRYILTYCFTSYAGICVVTTLFAEDSIFGFFVTYTCAQFHLLHDNIDSLISTTHCQAYRKYRVVTKEIVQREYNKNLKSIAMRHNQLMQFAKLLEDFFNPILLVNFMISSILICMVGFQLVTGKDMFIGDYVKFIVYISSSLCQLFILCWNGDSLIQFSTETAKHLYLCNWEGATIKPITEKYSNNNEAASKFSSNRMTLKSFATDKEFGNNLRFMIMCSQKPIRITAFKFSTLSLQSFTAILSTSMSYFTLLQTVYYDNQKKSDE